MMKLLLLSVVFLSFMGCASAPSRKAQAASRVKPVIAALNSYHKETRDYPQQLEELRPRYLSANVRYFDSTNAKHIWRVQYTRIDNNKYWVAVYMAPCSQAVFDAKGNVTSASGPAFK